MTRLLRLTGCVLCLGGLFVVSREVRADQPAVALPSPSANQGGQVGQAGPAVAPVTVEHIQKSAAAALAPTFYAVPLGEEFDRNQASQAPAAPTGTAGNVSAPLPPAPAGDAAAAPSLGTNFQGIGATGFRPADPHLAVGPNHIVQVVNSTLRISNKSGGTIGTNTFEGIFGKPTGSVFLFDPWVEYDHFANRFVVISIATNSAKTDSWYIVAVSRTATPGTGGGSWWVYYLRSDIDFPSTDTAFWPDYQKLGFDNTYFYITSNQFLFNSSSNTNASQYSNIRRYGKSQFYNGQSVSGVEWRDVRDPSNNRVFTIQPAVTFDAPGTEYLASSSSGAGSSIVVFRISQSGSPTLFSNTIATNSWLFPDEAVQKGSSTRINTGDCRLLNAVYRGSRLYVCHTVKRGSFPCACQYIGVNTSNLSKSLDVTIGFGSAYYSFPAMTVSGGGNLATVFNFSTSDRFAGAIYTQINLNGTIQPLALLKEGQASYVSFVGTRNRWGDYNGICVDPSNTSRVWFNSMWTTSTPNTWGTWVGSTSLTASSPSSDVRVAFDTSSNTLTLTGDDAANSVRVRSIDGRVVVHGERGTLVNGRSSVTLTVPARFSLEADLRGGNDLLTLFGVNLQRAHMSMGDGNDSIVLLSSVDDLQADGGDGMDAIVTTTSHVAQSHEANFP